MTRLTNQETLLLTAVLQQGPAALSAWGVWRESFPLEGIDAFSHRMIPLLHYNLCAQGIQHPLLRRYAAVRHFYQFRNRLLIQRAQEILSLFRWENIPTVALKGLSLALETYPGIELRPMSDIDLLVSKADGVRAINVLKSTGLNPHRGDFLEFATDPFRSFPSYCFMTAAGVPLVDLHVRLHWPIPSLVLPQRMLDEGRPLKVGAEWTLSAPPTEQAFFLILHGTRPGGGLRWASDVAWLIRRHDIDWSRLDALGKQYSCLTLVKESIDDVFAVMGAHPPASAQAALQGAKASLSDRLEWALRRRDYFNLRPPFGLWFDYRRFRHADRESGTSPTDLMTFLADRWMLHRKRDIPARALRKLYEHLIGDRNHPTFSVGARGPANRHAADHWTARKSERVRACPNM